MYKKIAIFFITCFALLFDVDAAPRSAVEQQAVTGGTKIAEAGTNTLVDSECQDSYFGCMDTFCMVDNVSGGRCQCNNKHADLMQLLNDLMEKDERAETVAGYASDFVKMGKAKDAVLNKANSATKKDKPSKDDKSSSKTFSRADWDAMFMTSGNDDDDDDEEETFVDNDDISNKHGDELYKASDSMCWEQTPQKCKSSKTSEEMVKMLYVQKIKSDCMAFENSIKQQQTEVNNKYADAQKSVRDAALKELANENKFNAGQCVKEFKQCMQTTAGCGNDFVGCVPTVKQSESKVTIHGDFSDTEIFASTMDNLLSKKILCDSVLNSCEKVKDDVWTMFLKDVSHVIKTAELNAESDLRSNCIKNVTDCYVKSCHEHFDVNNEKGSYDMCLSRPENYKSFCKIELEPCLEATGGSYDNPSASRLWNGILSKLDSMRVTACTDEFKACIQDDDRCGSDYSKCIGLDENDIALMCPDDKLTACYKEYAGKKETVRETLANVASGIMLQIRSGLLDACENAVKEAMIKTCGNSENCNELVIGDKVGSRTLELKFCEVNDDNNTYSNCKTDIKEIMDKELGKTVRNADLSKTKNAKHVYSGLILGRIMWDQVTPLSDYSGVISGDEYIAKVKDVEYMDDKTKDKVKTEVGAISNTIKSTISAVESDPRVQFCMTGRQVSGLTGKDGLQQYIGKSGNATFPNITQSARMAIVNGALLQAQKYYNEKYAEVLNDAIDGNLKLEERYAEISDANFHLGEQDKARLKCIELGEKAAHSGIMSDSGLAKYKIVRDNSNDGKLVGTSSESTYNFKRVVTTTFNMDKMICTKCTRTQNCKTPKSDYCKKWDDETEVCEDIKF